MLAGLHHRPPYNDEALRALSGKIVFVCFFVWFNQAYRSLLGWLIPLLKKGLRPVFFAFCPCYRIHLGYWL